MANEDDKLDLAALVHEQASKANELEFRLNYLIANHEGYVAISIGELKDYRSMITLSRDMFVMQSELLVKVEEGLDRLLEELGVDPKTLEDK